MKKLPYLIFLCVLMLAASATPAAAQYANYYKDSSVKGYTTRTGKHVRGHHRKGSYRHRGSSHTHKRK
jgi:hypothetical protein